MSMNHAIVVGRGLFISEGNPPYTVSLDRGDGYWIIPYDSWYEKELKELLQSKHFELSPEFDMTNEGRFNQKRVVNKNHNSLFVFA